MDQTPYIKSDDAQQTPTGRTDDAPRRLLNLFFVLNSSLSPLTTTQIVSDSDLGYGSTNRKSDERKFRRDRESLEQQGILIKEIRSEGAAENEESRWTIDRENTFIAGGLITEDDAYTLEGILTSELARQSTPMRFPLRRMLKKLAELRTEDAALVPSNQEQTPSNKVEESLWAGFSLQKSVQIDYKKADGSVSRRQLSIYGMFDDDGKSYVTGFDSQRQEVRTFRIDRIQRVSAPKTPYRIPENFDIDEYRFLSFDFKENEATCATPVSFSFPRSISKAEIEAITRTRGTLTQTNGCWIWNVDAFSLNGAASLCLAHTGMGMRPVAPQELIDCWNTEIETAVSAHEA